MPAAARCVVKSCRHQKNKQKCVFSKFPRDIQRCNDWIKIIGDSNLLLLTVEFLSANRFVCSCHFDINDYRTQLRKKLKDNAIPSIFEGQIIPLSEEQMKVFSLKNPIIIKTYATLEKVPAGILKINGDPLKPNVPLAIELSPTNDRENRVIQGGPKHRSPLTTETDEVDLGGTPHRKKIRVVSVAKRRITMNKIADEVGIPITKNLSATEKMLLKQLQEEKIKSRKLEKELLKQKEKNTVQRKRASDPSTISGLFNSPMLAEIVDMNLRNQGRKPGGNRYSPAQKLLSARIQQHSDLCYKFLANSMVMPTKRTINKSLNKFPVIPGINNTITSVIKENVSKVRE